MPQSMEFVREALRQGATMQALLDIDPADLDNLYADACQRFDQGDFIGAKKLLLILTRLSHWQFDYWLALGLTCQRLGEHDEAVHSFSQTGQLRLDDPRSAYLAGLSLHALGQLGVARQAFDAALNWCAAKPEYQELKQQVLHMQSLCPQQQERS
ncbi:MAG: SycD/LcrH family type III secretion system chaperone [Paludibacterium sp.]|uniref:SycD/LcrH family type III secretion system chaperone n=1 Tax=Paludibacterium sp. TaxID=1917523 RepID=UPI0025D4404A|nr:SycD/LcrH family type III secretion system chaperone [Paludibacterium sp.]MBV8046057.1 SycD/LcrH family type III secretion system chaperone [Paludibacterium sp.]MBV8646146.1 SycD/LcrH family type III secretion system chaperone [Paludibacterium sp.]